MNTFNNADELTLLETLGVSEDMIFGIENSVFDPHIYNVLFLKRQYIVLKKLLHLNIGKLAKAKSILKLTKENEEN